MSTLKLEDIKRVTVIGAGTMGSQIAQLCAENGYQVKMMDVKEEFVKKGLISIRTRLENFAVKKGKVTPEQMEAILARISGVTSIQEAARDADFVIEAVFEDINLKKQIFKELDGFCSPQTVLGSNTSSMSITEMAASTKRPDRVIGTHFFNPVTLMKLVEIAKAIASEDTLELTKKFIERLGKIPVPCLDSPGFLANRVYTPMFNEAVWCVFTGVGTPKDIDTAMKLGYNLPMGPLELGDYVGWDPVLGILEYCTRELGVERFAPCPLIRQLVRAGYLGKKVGKGIYEYYDQYMAKKA